MLMGPEFLGPVWPLVIRSLFPSLPTGKTGWRFFVGPTLGLTAVHTHSPHCRSPLVARSLVAAHRGVLCQLAEMVARPLVWGRVFGFQLGRRACSPFGKPPGMFVPGFLGPGGPVGSHGARCVSLPVAGPRMDLGPTVTSALHACPSGCVF